MRGLGPSMVTVSGVFDYNVLKLGKGWGCRRLCIKVWNEAVRLHGSAPFAHEVLGLVSTAQTDPEKVKRRTRIVAKRRANDIMR